MSNRVNNQLFNRTGSSHVTILESSAGLRDTFSSHCLPLYHLIWVSLPFLKMKTILHLHVGTKCGWFRDILQSFCSPTTGSRELHSHNPREPPARSSLEPRGAGLLPWASSVSGTAKPLLAALHANNKHNESSLSACRPATLLLWRKKKWTSANVSLWFTAKCRHTHTHAHRDLTPQHTADHACKLKLRLSCSWPSTLHSLFVTR